MKTRHLVQRRRDHKGERENVRTSDAPSASVSIRCASAVGASAAVADEMQMDWAQR
jgi:hypothetical protein